MLLLAVPADLEFQPWFAERGIEVSAATAPKARTPWIRAVAELQASAERVFAFLEGYAGYADLFPPLPRSRPPSWRPADRACDCTSSGPTRFRFGTETPSCGTKANGSPTGRFEFRGGNRRAAGADPSEGVRIARVEGETRIEPLGADRCRVTYTFLGDLGGTFPRAFAERAWKGEPVGYVLALRRALADPPAGAR